MQESSLHASLKEWYAQKGGQQEVEVGGYLIDVVLDDLLIEIQTSNFTAIKEKLNALLDDYQVRLVHPIAEEKWIVYLPVKGEKPLHRRKSPRHGRIEHLFLELVRIPHLPAHPNFSLEVLLTHEEEFRRANGLGSWRRQGVSIVDHRLIEIVHYHLLASPDDFRSFIPPTLKQPFTNRELAQAIGIRENLARRMTYCLRAIDVLHVAGKRGNAFLLCANELGRRTNP